MKRGRIKAGYVFTIPLDEDRVGSGQVVATFEMRVTTSQSSVRPIRARRHLP